MFFSVHHSRRDFFKVSFFTATLALLRPRLSWGSAASALLSAPLSLFNTHTGERLNVAYRTAAGAYDATALSEFDRLLRCHYTNEVHPIDPRTLDYLALLDQQLGGGHDIHIISAYRSPRYNALLQSKGRGVATHSLHLEGRALDVRIPGVELARLREAALLLGRGGVGYYPRPDFVHIDSGPVRRW
jgi:uncharacterized protein YcbK (DUF882 family)